MESGFIFYVPGLSAAIKLRPRPGGALQRSVLYCALAKILQLVRQCYITIADDRTCHSPEI